MYLLTFTHNARNIQVYQAVKCNFLDLNVKNGDNEMSTAIHSIGTFCSGCVAMAIAAISIATLATIIWVVFL